MFGVRISLVHHGQHVNCICFVAWRQLTIVFKCLQIEVSGSKDPELLENLDGPAARKTSINIMVGLQQPRQDSRWGPPYRGKNKLGLGAHALQPQTYPEISRSHTISIETK